MKIILENIRILKEVLSSFIKLRLFQEKLHTILCIIITKEGKNENTNVYLKIDDYCNFSSTCICEISFHLLFKLAIIKKFKNYLSRRGVGARPGRKGKGNASCPAMR